MLYDCFLFYNESDLLELRLRELDDLVDKFIVIQGEETFAGIPKPIYFKITKHYKNHQKLVN